MGRMVEHYDAFVIHNPEGTDLAFVQEMAMILEGPKYNFKLFLPWRDLHSTENNEIEILAEILTKRYKRNILLSNFIFEAYRFFWLIFHINLRPFYYF